MAEIENPRPKDVDQDGPAQAQSPGLNLVDLMRNDSSASVFGRAEQEQPQQALNANQLADAASNGGAGHTEIARAFSNQKESDRQKTATQKPVTALNFPHVSFTDGSGTRTDPGSASKDGNPPEPKDPLKKDNGPLQRYDPNEHSHTLEPTNAGQIKGPRPRPMEDDSPGSNGQNGRSGQGERNAPAAPQPAETEQQRDERARSGNSSQSSESADGIKHPQEDKRQKNSFNPLQRYEPNEHSHTLEPTNAGQIQDQRPRPKEDDSPGNGNDMSEAGMPDSHHELLASATNERADATNETLKGPAQPALKKEEFVQLIKDLNSNSFRIREEASEKLNTLKPSELLALDSQTREKADDPGSGAFARALKSSSLEVRTRAERIMEKFEGNYLAKGTASEWLQGRKIIGPGGLAVQENPRGPVPDVLGSNLTAAEAKTRASEMAALSKLEGAAGRKEQAGKLMAQSAEWANLDATRGAITKLDLIDATDKDLAKLKNLPNLKELAISDDISDKGAEHLKNMKGLQKLNIYSDKLTDKGLENIKGLVNLRELSVSSPNFTDKSLESLKGLKNLERLAIGSDKITDNFLKRMGDSKDNFKNLKELTVPSPQITDKGMETLRKQMPGLKV